MPLANAVTCQYRSEFQFHSPDFPATFLIPEEIKVPYMKKKMNSPNVEDLRFLNVTRIFNKQIVHLMMHL